MMSAMVPQVEAFICALSRASAPITDPVLKFGGSPVFYLPVDWPSCGFCGQQQTFLAQVPLQEPVLLSARYHMAYIFMCPGRFHRRRGLTCETWAANSGANAVLLQAECRKPSLHHHASEYPDYRVVLERTMEPAVDTADAALDDQLFEMVHECSKIGGVPSWLQYNDTPLCPACGGPMRFAAQLNAELDGPLPADPREWLSDRYKFFHFGGDDGIGYLFLCERECGAEAASFPWQCT